MVVVCAVKSCKANWTPNSNLSYFSFTKNKALLTKWLEAIPDLNEVKYYYKICSKHFRPEYIQEVKGKKYLTQDAVPTIFYSENIVPADNSRLLPSLLRGASTSSESLLLREQAKRKRDAETQSSDIELERIYPRKKMRSVQVQTSCIGEKLLARVNILQKKNKSLQARLRNLQKKNKSLQARLQNNSGNK